MHPSASFIWYWYLAPSTYVSVRFCDSACQSRCHDDVIKWIFSALLALCAGNSPVTDEFPAQCPVTRSFDVFLDLCLTKLLNKQSRRSRFKSPSYTLRLQRNVNQIYLVKMSLKSTRYGIIDNQWASTQVMKLLKMLTIWVIDSYRYYQVSTT